MSRIISYFSVIFCFLFCVACGNAPVSKSPTLVVLKLDDVVTEEEGEVVSERWQRVSDFLEENQIKASFGVIGYTLVDDNPAYFKWITDRAARGYIEFWNHGFLYRTQNADGTFEPQYAVGEFQRSYEEQLYSLRITDSLAKAKLGLDLPVWGPHWSGMNEATDSALTQMPQIRMIFGYETPFKLYKGFVFRNTVDIEFPVHNPDFEKFKEAYHARKFDPDYFYMQGHPRSWDDARWENFVKIIEFLKTENVRFVTPSELLEILNAGK